MSYDPQLPTEVDWVRFLTGDPGQLEDEAVQALLDAATARYGVGPWVRYLVAAQVLDQVPVRWAVTSNGVTAETVGKLSIRRGASTDTLAARAARYREQAARLLGPTRYRVTVV